MNPEIAAVLAGRHRDDHGGDRVLEDELIGETARAGETLCPMRADYPECIAVLYTDDEREAIRKYKERSNRVSANNWTTCPRCKAREDAARDRQRREAEEAYGHVPQRDYEELVRRLQVEPAEKETLREDYGIRMGADGTFAAAYRGSCEVCGFAFRFAHEERVGLDMEERNG